MISLERDERPRERLLLLWATVLSLLIHALFVPLAAWMGLLHLPWLRPPPAQRETVVASTAVRIERRPVPQPRVQQAPHPVPAPVAPRPHPAQRAAPPAVPRHELAREAPSAPPQPPPQSTPPTQAPTLQQQIAQQEHAFSQEIAQLHARNNPLSLATRAPETAAAYRRTYFDVAGHRDVNAVQVEVIPLRHWYAGSTICYYTRYVAQYTHGGSEEGTIPWPVCYPLGADRIAHPPFVHDIPVPLPPPGYVLPPGTYLTPLLSRIYANRSGERNSTL